MQFCKYIKSNGYTQSIPIILLTHLNYSETRKFGTKVDTINYIPKDAFSDAILLETTTTARALPKSASYPL